MNTIILDGLTDRELYMLRFQVSQKLGIFDMVTVSVDDVIDQLDSNESKIKPSSEDIKTVLAYVSRKYDGDGFNQALDWAIEMLEDRHSGDEE